MHRREFISKSGSLALMGTIAGCSTNASSSAENNQIVVRATNSSDSIKQITVVGESSEGGDAFFTGQLALLGNAQETQVVATVNPQKWGDDTLTTIIVTVEGGETQTLEYNPDPGNEDVDIRIGRNVIRFNYD